MRENLELFTTVLNEAFSNVRTSSGRVSNDGNGMVGGAYGDMRADANSAEADVSFELDGKSYEVLFLVDACLSYSYDDSVGCGEEFDIDFNDKTIRVKSVWCPGTQSEVTDEKLRKELIDIAEKEFLSDPNHYLEYLWDDYRDSYEDYD